MSKLFIAALSVVSMVTFSMAQKFEAGFDIGLGIGVGGYLKGFSVTIDSSGAATDYKQVYGSGGGGVKGMVDFTCFITENIGILAMTGYSMLGNYTTGSQYPSGSNQNTVVASYVPINLGLKFKAKFGSIMPYLYLAPGVYLARAIGIRTFTESPDYVETYSYAPGFGFSGGIGAGYNLSDKLGLRVELAPTYAFANLAKTTFEQDGITYTIIYKNNTIDLPADTETTSYRRNQIRDSFSSIAAKVGLFFAF
jgi:outer membrane protein W